MPQISSALFLISQRICALALIKGFLGPIDLHQAVRAIDHGNKGGKQGRGNWVQQT